jgi:hypothetical protein
MLGFASLSPTYVVRDYRKSMPKILVGWAKRSAAQQVVSVFNMLGCAVTSSIYF